MKSVSAGKESWRRTRHYCAGRSDDLPALLYLGSAFRIGDRTWFLDNTSVSGENEDRRAATHSTWQGRNPMANPKKIPARKKQPLSGHRLGIDLGGTKILAAVVTPDGQIVGEAKKKTKPEIGPEGVVGRIVSAANEAVAAAGLRMKNVDGGRHRRSRPGKPGDWVCLQCSEHARLDRCAARRHVGATAWAAGRRR